MTPTDCLALCWLIVIATTLACAAGAGVLRVATWWQQQRRMQHGE